MRDSSNEEVRERSRAHSLAVMLHRTPETSKSSFVHPSRSLTTNSWSSRLPKPFLVGGTTGGPPLSSQSKCNIPSRTLHSTPTVLRTGAIEVVTCALIPNPATILEDRSGIGVIAQIEEVAVDYLDAVFGAIDVAVEIRQRQREALFREFAVEQAVDARDELLPHLGLAVLRQRQQELPSLLRAGNVGWRRVKDAAEPSPEDGRQRGVERYVSRVVLDLDTGDLQHVFIGAETILFAPLVSKERQR